MAKITPMDVVKGISGKYGSGAIDNFATNKRFNKSSPTRKNEKKGVELLQK
ncbi:MAG: hypothetical protein ACI3Y0_00710 [Prevotella sp.]